MKLLNKYFYILKKIDKRITTIKCYFAEFNLAIGYNVIKHNNNFKDIFWICYYEKGKVRKYCLNGAQYSIEIKSIKISYLFQEIKSFILNLKNNDYEII